MSLYPDTVSQPILSSLTVYIEKLSLAVRCIQTSAIIHDVETKTLKWILQ